MTVTDNNRVHPKRDEGTFDFQFPSKEYFLATYTTEKGDEMFLKSERFVTPCSKYLTFSKLYVAADGTPKLEEIEDEHSLPADILLRLDDQLTGVSYYGYSQMPRLRTHLFFLEDFNRMHNYDTYLQYRDYYQKPWWRRLAKREWPKPTRFDGVFDVIDGKMINWGYPNSKVLKTRASPSGSPRSVHESALIDHRTINDYSRPLFSDFLNIFHAATFQDFDRIPTSSFNSIKETLCMEEDEPLLYRMAEFHDPLTKLVYFIGTFENQLVSEKPFTIMLLIDIHEPSVMLNSRLGDNGMIYDFKVHVDSPPIVDQMANCAVILSFSEAEILVLCLETFKNIRISLHDWVTEGFLDRWERDKRRICMTFLSNYTKLVFFPKYSREHHEEEIPDDENFMPMSTLVNWDQFKKYIITPFLEKSRP